MPKTPKFKAKPVFWDSKDKVVKSGMDIELAEELALVNNLNPSENLANALFIANKNVHEKGEERYVNKLATDYPLLKKAIS